MTKDFEIDGITLQVHKEATKTFYLTENKITDNCGCDDCAFYANIWIKQSFEIFQMLEEMGVDLGKNLSSEPTGVWCIRDDNGQLIHFDQDGRKFNGAVIQTITSKQKAKSVDSEFKVCFRGAFPFEMK